MNKLWAPWRITYIKSAKKKIKCIFCGAQKKPYKNHYLVFKTPHSLCMLNLYPYNNGHLMAAPLRHTGEISGLSDAEMLDLMKTVVKAQKMLDAVLKPHGYNIGMNISDIAGAGIPDHLHIHIVPRWKGDTNFMPTVAGTKIISQSLDELYKQLKNNVP
jgi:ATP adenylyltransferase